MENCRIRTEKLCKVYNRGESEIHALDQVSISVAASEMVAITGTSGAGKSTLLHILGGLDAPTSGEVWYGDKNIITMSDTELSRFRCEKIGFVFQFFNLLPELTAWENIIFPTTLTKKKCDKEYVQELCETLMITDRLKHLPSELSGGQQQRVAIARALVNCPEVLLCDEPTGNLDENSTQEVMKLLQLVREKYGQTILLITHDMQVAKACGRVLAMKDGKIA